MAQNREAQLRHDLRALDRGINSETLEQTLMLAVEIAREGCEGRKAPGTRVIQVGRPVAFTAGPEVEVPDGIIAINVAGCPCCE